MATSKKTKLNKKRSKKPASHAVPDVGLKVTAHSYGEVTREADPNDRWSGEDTTSSWNVEGISLAKEYPNVTACFPVEAGDTVYLVFGVYSTGDSFSHHEDGSIDYIDVYKTHAKAEATAKTLREHNNWYRGMNDRWAPITAKERKALSKKYKSAYSLEIVRENGSKMSVHIPWNGYFETLSYIEVASFTVNANERGRY